MNPTLDILLRQVVRDLTTNRAIIFMLGFALGAVLMRYK